MKLIRHGDRGNERADMIDTDGRIRVLPAQRGDLAGRRLSPAALAEIAALDIGSLPFANGNTRICARVPRSGTFVCIDVNDRGHAEGSDLPIPAGPIVSGKWTSAVAGPNDDVEMPRGSETTDWDVEPGVVVGTPGRHIASKDAPAHGAGYRVVHDVSEPTCQLERGGAWGKGKGCDTFGPIGPWLVTADEIADPRNRRLWPEVDGIRHQDGAPAGVGPGQKPPVYLPAGQTVRLGTDGLGGQAQHMVSAR